MTPEAKRLVALARTRVDNDQRTHWEGCESSHRECLIQRMADELSRPAEEGRSIGQQALIRAEMEIEPRIHGWPSTYGWPWLPEQVLGTQEQRVSADGQPGCFPRSQEQEAGWVTYAQMRDILNPPAATQLCGQRAQDGHCNTHSGLIAGSKVPNEREAAIDRAQRDQAESFARELDNELAHALDAHWPGWTLVGVANSVWSLNRGDDTTVYLDMQPLLTYSFHPRKRFVQYKPAASRNEAQPDSCVA